MFIIDTLTYSLNIYSFFHQIREILLKGIFQGDGLVRVEGPVETIDAINEPLYLLMLIPGDCIVIWRAYAVWTRSKIIMIIPVIFLLGYIANFPFLITCSIRHRYDLAHVLGPTACLATDASAWILSFSANISATLAIFYTAWTFFVSQRPLRADGALRTQFSPVPRIMQLFVESGLAYFLVVLNLSIPDFSHNTGFVADTKIRARYRDLLGPGILPTLTILFVSLYGSFEENYTLEVSGMIQFATPGSPLTLGPSATLPFERRRSQTEPTDSGSSSRSYQHTKA
ncbi:hypothetical protein C8J56DRAFT_1105270 [Mycena floridula]|nr:hypothetical protein C8J56DRAFT_1105270 [Mycena floridula]